jgi:quercetin dioxygenase-like cupin family protein
MHQRPYIISFCTNVLVNLIGTSWKKGQKHGASQLRARQQRVNQVEREYHLVDDLATTLGKIQPGDIVSRTIFKGDSLRVILFGIDVGEELSEHTASQAAIIQIIQGEATVTVGDDTHELKIGSWLQMPPRLKHSVYAKSSVVMLLTMYEAN